MTYALPVTTARKQLLSLVDEVDENYSRVDLTKKGKVKASLVSPEYLDSLEETIYTLTHSMNNIRKAEEEIAKGNYVTLDVIEKDFQERLKKHDSKRNNFPKARAKKA